jgi:hypothetical protein
MNKDVLMKQFVRGVCLIVIVCTCCNAVFAQESDKRTEYLHLQPRRVTINSAIFSNVEVIDNRYDTTHLGFVQKGAFNRKEALILSQPLKNEIGATVTKMIDGANKQEGTLLINIRRFYVSELTLAMSESGTFGLKAEFYLKRDSGYKRMFTIDSNTVVSGLDVTKKLLDTTPETFGAFIQQAASFDPAQCDTRLYTAYDIQHIEELEKREIPVYNVDIPKKGMYATYEDFKNNRPSSENVLVENRKGFSRPFIYELKENGKKGREILRKYYYAVCDGEKMFISRPNTLYQLTKTNGEFYFTGLGKDAGDMGTVILASALFGMFAGGAAANHDTAIFEFRIDHLTGRFIPVKKIKD